MLASSLTGSSGDLVRPNQDDDRFSTMGAAINFANRSVLIRSFIVIG
jgi:hypothetical protein